MERRWNRALIILLVSLAQLFASVIQAEEPDPAETEPLLEPEEPSSADTEPLLEGAVSIHYWNGIIDADINNAPVAEVLRELEAQTGARIARSAPADPGERISATVRTMSLQEGLRIILRGYSFAIYADPGADAPVVILLSEPTSVAVPTTAVTAQPGAVSQPGSPGSVRTNGPIPGAIPVQSGALPSAEAPVPAEELSDLPEDGTENESDEEDPVPLPAR
jgi:hypothetical protein